MNKETVQKTAKQFFDSDKSRKEMFATESGHFFFEAADRATFIKKSQKDEKAVDFKREQFEKKETKELTFKDCPGVKILEKRGIESIEALKEVEDLSKLDGIGPGKVDEIKEFIKNFE